MRCSLMVRAPDASLSAREARGPVPDGGGGVLVLRELEGLDGAATCAALGLDRAAMKAACQARGRGRSRIGPGRPT